MHDQAKHFSIHRLFLLLKVQFIKCSAAARGDGAGDMDDQAQRSERRALLSSDKVLMSLNQTKMLELLCIP